jgi:hypothetical protein
VIVKPLGKLEKQILSEFDPYDESISADEWAAKRNAQIAQTGESPPQTHSLFWLESDHDLLIELRKVWRERMEAPAMQVVTELVNLGDSPSEIEEFRKHLPVQYDIARESDHELLTLRDELQTFWKEVWKETRHSGLKFGDNVKVALTLSNWWKHYDMDTSGWKIFFEAGCFFPTLKNFRGIIARTLYEKRRKLTQCANDDCKRYFIAARSDFGKFCLRPECQQKFGAARVKKHYDKLKNKPARKSRRSK